MCVILWWLKPIRGNMVSKSANVQIFISAWREIRTSDIYYSNLIKYPRGLFLLQWEKSSYICEMYCGLLCTLREEVADL